MPRVSDALSLDCLKIAWTVRSSVLDSSRDVSDQCLCARSIFSVPDSYPCGPCILSILPNNVAPHYKRATATALQLAIANCGYVIGPIYYWYLLIFAQRFRCNIYLYSWYDAFRRGIPAQQLIRFFRSIAKIYSWTCHYSRLCCNGMDLYVP